MALPYIGGKSLISKHLILPLIPKDIETYIETFSGMFWVFFKMDINDFPNLKTVVYNDFNKLNTNLFKCLKEDHQRLLKVCEEIPVQIKRNDDSDTPPECREYFNKAQSEIFHKDFKVSDDADYETAAKYALILSSVFSGSKPETSKFIDLRGKYHSKFTSFMNKLKDPKWQSLFERIDIIENMDFEDVIKKYDSERTYFYCDPPYFKTENYYSNHDFDRNDHERLANTLNSVKGKFSLSYYDFPKLSEWFPKDKFVWKQKDFAKSASAKSGVKQNKGTELLIMNYEIK